MKKVICNIPHAGLTIPDWAAEDFIVSRNKVERFAEKMVDLDVDKLFDFVDESNMVTTELSRVVVDMERYRNDKDEYMSKLGMGLFYEKDNQGNRIRTRGESYKLCLEEYDKYHQELYKKVKACTERYGRCYILDCHSFHDDLNYTEFDEKEFPDVCVGFNENYPSEEAYTIRKVFENAGYTVKFNIPFSGSILPQDFISDCRVKTIMLELNRRIYCEDRFCAADFNKVRNICMKTVEVLDNACI